MQQVEAYPIPLSIVDLLNIRKPSYHNVAGSMDLVNKIQTTREENPLHKYSVSPTEITNRIKFQEVQKSMVNSAFSFDLKMSKNLLTPCMITELIPHSNNPISVEWKMTDWKNKQHLIDDNESVTSPIPEQTPEKTTERMTDITTERTTDKTTESVTTNQSTTPVVINNSTTTMDDILSSAARTKRVLRKHYGEIEDKQWFSIEVSTNANWKSPSPEPMANVKCSCSHTSYQINKMKPDIRIPIPGEQSGSEKEVGDQLDDSTDCRSY